MVPRLVSFVLALTAAWGCRQDTEPPATAAPDGAPSQKVGGDLRQPLLAALGEFEERRRAVTDFAHLPPFSAQAGADPWAVVADGRGGALGLLRGADRLVWLSPQGQAHIEVPVASHPTALARRANEVFVAGEGTAQVSRFTLIGDGLQAQGGYQVPGSLALRDLVVTDQQVFVADRYGSRVLALAWPAGAMAPTGAPTEVGRCDGVIGLAHAPGLLAATCLLERGLWLAKLDDLGRGPAATTRVVHEGPLWSVGVAAYPAQGQAWVVAAGGVEDHALDRSDGSFGYVDSWLYTYVVRPCGTGLCAEPGPRLNLCDFGLITPKWVGVEVDGDEARVRVSGYGGVALLDVRVGLAVDKVVDTQVQSVPAGLRQVAQVGKGWIAADPLLDRWVVNDGDALARVAPATNPDTRPVDVRLGEALFFSSLLAPEGQNRGRASRFTCETCHFEGGVDGRVHYTGRGQIHAATKPLLGLFNNRPHFSRALDRTMAKMVDNEFAVANRGAAGGPDFALDPAEIPWLADLGVSRVLGPKELRRAFMAFLMAFTHETNPVVAARLRGPRGNAVGYSALERRGAQVFAHHCEGCHQARLVVDDETTRVPFEKWEPLVFSDAGPLTWATAERMRTGVEPYVHDEGARVTSLRRLWLKRPYLTNGQAPTLEDVLARIRVGPPFAHDGPPGSAETSARLSADQREALLAFMALL